MHILCPHCRNPIELVSVTAHDEVACTACGSSFHVDTEMTTDMKRHSGQRIGRFELLETIGRGAFGTVYLARDPKLDRKVAIKLPRAGNLSGNEDLDRFLREARSVAQLRHPSIVGVHEVGQIDDLPYLVSDFVQGVTLADLLSGQSLGFQQSARLIAEVADALQYAHEQGVVHRDVKPSNIMIGDDGKPCVMDFGLAKRGAGEITMTTDGQVLGTPAYMSPEQARGESHAADARSDVYSLGVILYQLLTRELPFRGTQRMLLHQVLHDDPRRPRSLNDRIPRDLETICLKCLEKNPDRRYPTARAFADDLRRFLAGQPVLARPMLRTVKLWRWARRQPALASAVCVGLLALLTAAAAGAGFAIYQRSVNLDLQRQQMQIKQALDLARQERRRADEQHRTAQSISADLALDRGLELCEANKVADGLLWLVRGLELAPDDAHDLRRVIRTNLAGWSQHLHPLELMVPHPDKLYDVAVHPEGRVIATACEDGLVRLLDLTSGDAVATALPHSAAVYTVQFSPDGRLLASGDAAGKARLWNWELGTIVEPTHEHTDRVTCVAFSPDGTRLVSGSWGRTVRMSGIADRTLSNVIDHGEIVNAVAFDDAGQLIIGGNKPGTNECGIAFWDVANWQQAGQPLTSPTVYSLAPHQQTGHLLLGTVSFEASLWSTTKREQITRLSHQSWVFDVAFSPDGSLAATASRDGTAQLWDVVTARPVGAPLTHLAAVRGCAFSTDGTLVISCGEDQMLRVWRIQVDPFFGSHFACHSNFINAVSFSSDGNSVLTGGGDQTAHLFDATSGRVRLRINHGGWVHAVALSPDRTTIATAGHGGKVRFWDAATGQPQPFVLEHPWDVQVLRFSPDGQQILVGCGDFEHGDARLWSVESGELVAPPLEHRQRVLAVAFSPDGKRVATASEDQTVRLWDLEDGATAGPTLQHQNAVHAVVFHPQKTDLLVTADWNGGVQCWDVRNGQPTGFVFKHEKPVIDAALSRDGKWLLTGSFDSSARIWDMATGKRLHPPLPTWRRPIESVDFSPLDHRICAAAGQDHKARIWMLPSPIDGETERLGRWIEVATGMTMDSMNERRLLDAATWNSRHQTLRALGGSPKPAFPTAFSRTRRLAPFYKIMGHRCLREGHRAAFEKALSHFEALLKLDPEDFSANYDIARCYGELGNRQAQIAALSKCIEMDPTHSAAFHSRGRVYIFTERWEEAERDLARARALGFKEKIGFNFAYMAVAYSKLGRYSDALNEASRAVEQEPDDAYIHFYASWAHACCSSGAEDPEQRDALMVRSLEFLARAEALGFSDIEAVSSRATDFSPLESDPKYREIYKRIEMRSLSK